MRRRSYGKVDANQNRIVRALRIAGAFVEPRLAQLGGGVPDLLVAYHGGWNVLEIKDGSKVRSRQRLTPDEAAWHRCALAGGEVPVVHNVREALTAVGVLPANVEAICRAVEPPRSVPPATPRQDPYEVMVRRKEGP